MHGFLQDVRYGLRVLLKTPLFTLAAVLLIAVGIGANATVFTWFKAAFLQPVPGAWEPTRLVTMNMAEGERGGYSNSYPEYLYLRDHNTVFSGLIAYNLIPLNLGVGREPEQVWAGIVTANYFDVLGVRPILGRGFLPAEETGEGAHPVAVLGYGLWQRRFAGDRGVVGRQVIINKAGYTIVGVTPRGFAGTYGGLQQDLFVPMTMAAQLTSTPKPLEGSAWMEIMGRLRPGTSLQQAQADVHVLAPQFRASSERITKRFGESFDIKVQSASSMERGLLPVLGQFVPIFLAMAGLLLLIVCANVANLLLSKASGRQREIAIRVALGATSGRLARQLLTESLLIAVGGGIAGIAIAVACARLIVSMVPSIGIPLAFDLRVDSPVLLFTIALTAVTALIFGLVPATQASHLRPAGALKDAAASVTGGSRTRLRNAFVVAQVALSFIALTGAGLMLRTVQKAAAAEPGFDPDGVLIAKVDLFLGGYDEAHGREFYRQVVDRAAALPGVQFASLSTYVPMGLSGGGNTRTLSVPGYDPGAREDMNIVTDSVGPAWLRTLGIGLVEGRDFTPEDRDGSQPVVIVNAATVKRYFPGRPAIGASLKIGDTMRVVVGVARDITYRNVAEGSPDPAVYLPILQDYESSAAIVLRTRGNPRAVWPALRDAVGAIDPALALSGVESLREHIATSYFTQRTPAAVLSVFGALAMILAAIGLYALMAFSMARRTREIGIRLALGAPPSSVVGLVFRQGMKLSAIGIGVGLAASVGVVQLLKSLLYGVDPYDVPTFAGTLVVLLAAASLASFLPARRATRVDPLVALRDE
jgi:predicted permease